MGCSALRKYHCSIAFSDTEPHRGLLIAISNTIPSIRIQTLLVIEGSLLILRILCRPPLRDLIVVNFHGRHMRHDDRLERITIITTQYPNDLLILGGDFNIHPSPEETERLNSGLTLPIPQPDGRRDILSFLMNQLSVTSGNYISSPISRSGWIGRTRPSIIDYIMLSKGIPLVSYTTQALCDIVGSDHLPILCVFKTTPYLRTLPRYVLQTLSGRQVIESAEDIKRCITSTPIIRHAHLDSNTLLANINSRLEQAVSQVLHRPIKLAPTLPAGFRHTNSTWSPHQRKLVNKLKRSISTIQRRQHSTGYRLDSDSIRLLQLKTQFHQQCSFAKREARAVMEQQVHALRKCNLSRFYTFAKAHMKIPAKSHGLPRLLSPDNVLVEGIEANLLLASHLSQTTSCNPTVHSAHMTTHLVSTIVANNVEAVTSTILSGAIDIEELTKALQRMQSGGSPGVDGIPTELLKISTSSIKQQYLELFNHVLRSHKIPEMWRNSVTVAIPKKGDPLLPANWRGISLLCTSYKLFATILTTRLTTFLSTYSPLHWCQAGFRANRSTLEHILALNDICDRRRTAGSYTDVLFGDFQAAFDMVHPLALRAALLEHRVPMDFTNLLISLYSAQQSTLRPLNPTDEPANYYPETGVRQGCSLAPLLFSVVIDMLARRIQNCMTLNINLGVTVPGILAGPFRRVSLLLYADDFVLLSHSSATLQLLVTIVDTWSSDWGFLLSQSKSKVMHIRPARATRPIVPIYCKTGILQAVSQFTYLGVIITDNLDPTVEQTNRLKLLKDSHTNLDTLYWNNGWTIKCRRIAFESLTASVGLYGTPTSITNPTSFQPYSQLIATLVRPLLSLPKVPSLSTACDELGMIHPWISVKTTQYHFLLQLLNANTLAGALLKHQTPHSIMRRIVQSFSSMGVSLLGTFTNIYVHQRNLVRQEAASTQRVAFYYDNFYHVRWTDQNYELLNFRFSNLHFGRSILLQFRTGTWRTPADDTRIYCKKYKLQLPPNLDQCKFCGAPDETLQHILLECPLWTSIRQQYLPPLLSLLVLQPTWDDLSCLKQASLILGGSPIGVKVRCSSEQLAVARAAAFVQTLVEARNALKICMGYE